MKSFGRAEWNRGYQDKYLKQKKILVTKKKLHGRISKDFRVIASKGGPLKDKRKILLTLLCRCKHSKSEDNK